MPKNLSGGKAYQMPKAKLRSPKTKMTANKRMMSKMKTRLNQNPYAKKGK